MLHRSPLSVALALCASCYAPRTVVPTSIPPTFPDTWIGEWTGEVILYGPRGERSRVDMTRIVAPTDDPDRYTWTTIYSGDAGDQTREYELVVRDRATGSYAIDEKNGIVLDARVLGSCLYSWFEVNGTKLVVREQLRRDHQGLFFWSFEILTADTTTVRTGHEIPVLGTIPTGLQRAHLRRVRPERQATASGSTPRGARPQIEVDG